MLKGTARILCVSLFIGASQQAAALSGNFSATVVAVDIDSRVVAGWLPAGVALKNRDHPTHKVILLMGTQHNVGILHPYNEIIVVVPDVLYRGRTYMYFPRLYLNNRWAVKGGIFFFGFPKQLACINHQRCRFELRQNNTVLLTARLNHGSCQTISRGTEYRELTQLLSQPMLLLQCGEIVCSRFDMRLKCERLTAVDVDELVIHGGFMPGLAGFRTAITNIEARPFGAFYMHCAYWHVPRCACRCP